MKTVARLVIASACLALVMLGLASTTTAASSATAATAATAKATKMVSARTLLKQLKVRVEKRTGYSRSKFPHWREHGDGCDTRSVVLKQESKTRITQNGSCTIKRGKWRSEYDGKVVRRAAKLDIDHRVPLAEAWDSGAKRWTKATRTAFANDITYRESLVAVTLSTNRAKGAGDVADWLPKKNRCVYTARYVAVKWRWSLTIDRAEKRAIKRVFADCSRKKLRVAKPAKATVKPGSGGGGDGDEGGGGGGDDRETDPRFNTCTEAIDHGYGPYYEGSDPEYGWYEDRDGDGVVCE